MSIVDVVVVVDIPLRVHIKRIVGVRRVRRFVTKFPTFVSRPKGRVSITNI